MSSAKPRILIADDQPDVLEALRLLLKGEQYEIETAKSPAGILTALEAWVERGAAPAKIIGSGTVATDPTQTLTRPLCPYPQTAHYLGRGSSNDAANFSCNSPADVR